MPACWETLHPGNTFQLSQHGHAWQPAFSLLVFPLPPLPSSSLATCFSLILCLHSLPQSQAFPLDCCRGDRLLQIISPLAWSRIAETGRPCSPLAGRQKRARSPLTGSIIAAYFVVVRPRRRLPRVTGWDREDLALHFFHATDQFATCAHPSLWAIAILEATSPFQTIAADS